MKPVKKADTQYPVLDLIRDRWSPRSFSPQPISEADVQTLIEAASWSPSASNLQPRRYIYAHRGEPGFERIWSGLLPGNQPWTKHAAVLMVAVGIKESADGKPQGYYLHDTGMANAFLILQAQSLGIHGHFMAGIDKEKLHDILQLSSAEEAVAGIALGYQDEAEKLEEPFRSRELAPRERKPLQEVGMKLTE